MMVAFVLGEVAAYQMGMTVWFIIAAALFVFHRKLHPVKPKCSADRRLFHVAGRREFRYNKR